MLLRTVSCRRPGLSLLEVIIATAIFLMAVIGLQQLLSVASEQALEIEMRGQAARLCCSKMAEVQAGVLPLTSGGDTFDEDPDYSWSVDAEQGTAPNLWVVTVRVTRQKPGDPDNPIEVTLTQMLLDPMVAGSTADAATVSGTDTATGTTTTADPNATGAGAVAPASGAAAPKPTTPASGGTAPRPTMPATPRTPTKGGS